MKTDYTSNLRYNEKIKETQTFMSVDGLMKKIRKKYEFKENQYIDAQKKLREIMCFWKQDWEYQHFHPIFLNPTVYYPIILMDFENNTSDPVKKQFISFVRNFIQRMKVGQQNQINYKLQQMSYERSFTSGNEDEFKLISTSQKSVGSALKLMYKVTKNMIQDLKQSVQIITNPQGYQEQIDDESMKYAYNSKLQLNYIMWTLKRHIFPCQDEQKQMIEEQKQQQPKEKNLQEKKQTEQLILFTANVMNILQKMKIEERYYGSVKPCGSSFISVQPQVGQLTYILHPIMFAINGHFNKEKLQKQFDRKNYKNKYYQDNQKIKQTKQEKCIKWHQAEIGSNKLTYIIDDLKHEEEKHSKIIFINLDGYESEYNIEFAKNFNKHLMYISFPNFDCKTSQNNQCREKRFYKKIMFNQTTRSNQVYSNKILQKMAEMEYLTENPQNYHENVNKLYQPRQQFTDNSQNIFIFPMKMEILGKKHQEQARKDASVESYQSFFIRYMMKNHLYHHIRSFGPSHIIISYSNIINIEQPHFIQMMQELTKLSKYKLMLFPNFTTSYVQQIRLQIKDRNEQEQDYAYGYQVSNARIRLPIQEQFHDINQRCIDNCCLTLAFLNKLAIFLKVSSGTYNLQSVYERQNSLSKYKNVKVFPHVQFLFEVLGKQFEKIKDKVDKTMLNATSSIILNAKKDCQKDLEKSIPTFYKQSYQVLKLLIVSDKNSEKMRQENEAIPIEIRRQYQNDVNRIKEDHSQKSLQKLFDQYINCEMIERSDNKFHYSQHIYLKTRPQNVQYGQVINDNEDMKNASGIHRVSFQLKKSESLPIYKDSSVVYQTRQIGKKQCFVLLMNHLSRHQNQICHYIGKIPITVSKIFKEQIQKCVVLPIQFFGGQTDNKFKVKCQWNYAETTNNLILYWPSQYDFIRAQLFKFNQQRYQPKITNEIYVASMQNCTKFFQVQHNNQNIIIPRKGCSYYNLNDELFLFGGSYQREFNYLNVQHDITSMKFTTSLNELSQDSRVQLKNIKSNLYSNEVFNEKIKAISENQQIQLNSYARPKFQIQFFELEELRDLNVRETAQLLDKIKTVIMFGGYGQNFINPHSLLTYFYYELKFNIQTGQLQSIIKKNILQKVVPVNVKSFIKNKSIFVKSNVFKDGNNALSDDFINQSHYLYHRVVYKMNQDQVQYKIKALYAYELYSNDDKYYEPFAQRIGQKRFTQQNEQLKFQISSQYKNHLIVFRQDRNYVFSINYEMKKQRQTAANTNNNSNELYVAQNNQIILENPYVKLTNKSIISIDYRNDYIYAIIKHDKNTKDKCILVYHKLALSRSEALNSDSALQIYLKPLQSFDIHFQLHVLLAARKDQLAVIHGSCFQGYEVKDYIFKLKKDSKELYKQKTLQIQPRIISIQLYYSCTSFMSKKDHYISCINFMSFNSKVLKNVFAMDEFTLNLVQKQIYWQETRPLIHFMLIWNLKGQEKVMKRQSLKFHTLKRAQGIFCMVQSKDLATSNKKVVFKIQNFFKQSVIVKDQEGQELKVFKIYLMEADKEWQIMSSSVRVQKNQGIYEQKQILRKQ